MVALADKLLHNLKSSPGVLILLLVLVLVAFKLNGFGTAAPEGAQVKDDNTKSSQRFEQSLAQLNILDRGLLECIRKAASDRGISRREGTTVFDDVRGMKLLYCRASNIKTLVGIGQLTQFIYLDISKNYVQSLAPLRSLSRLDSLNVTENPLGNIRVVRSLTGLRELHLPDLPTESCEEIELLVRGLKSNAGAVQCAQQELFEFERERRYL